jgi:hypothetical protein
MTSPYPDRPLIPLAVALPLMLDKIEAELVTAGATQKWCLRAEPVRGLLTGGLSPAPP